MIIVLSFISFIPVRFLTKHDPSAILNWMNTMKIRRFCQLCVIPAIFIFYFLQFQLVMFLSFKVTLVFLLKNLLFSNVSNFFVCMQFSLFNGKVEVANKWDVNFQWLSNLSLYEIATWFCIAFSISWSALLDQWESKNENIISQDFEFENKK